VCAELESQVGEAVDDGTRSGSREAFSFAGLAGVADALNAGEVSGPNVGHGVADECAFARVGVEGVYCLGEQVRAGLRRAGSWLVRATTRLIRSSRPCRAR